MLRSKVRKLSNQVFQSCLGHHIIGTRTTSRPPVRLLFTSAPFEPPFPGDLSYDDLCRFLDRVNHGRPMTFDSTIYPRAYHHLVSAGMINPTFPIIHVTGTNGKGSVSLKIAEAVRKTYSQVPLRIGLYTSPHIGTIRERIQLNGIPVCQEDYKRIVLQAYNAGWQVVQDSKSLASSLFGDEESNSPDPPPLSLFELNTLAFLVYMTQSQADLAVIEVGLGGWKDATNIVDKDLAIVTSIGLEHSAVLGNDKDLITLEKAGITRDCPLLIGPSVPVKPSLSAIVRNQFSHSFFHQSDDETIDTSHNNPDTNSYNNSNSDSFFSDSNVPDQLSGGNDQNEDLDVLKRLSQPPGIPYSVMGMDSSPLFALDSNLLNRVNAMLDEDSHQLASASTPNRRGSTANGADRILCDIRGMINSVRVRESDFQKDDYEAVLTKWLEFRKKNDAIDNKDNRNAEHRSGSTSKGKQHDNNGRGAGGQYTNSIVSSLLGHYEDRNRGMALVALSEIHARLLDEVRERQAEEARKENEGQIGKSGDTEDEGMNVNEDVDHDESVVVDDDDPTDDDEMAPIRNSATVQRARRRRWTQFTTKVIDINKTIVRNDNPITHLPISSPTTVSEGLAAQLPCRFERYSVHSADDNHTTSSTSKSARKVEIVLDVAHNPQALKELGSRLATTYPTQTIHIVFACSKDKDISNNFQSLLTPLLKPSSSPSSSYNPSPTRAPIASFGRHRIGSFALTQGGERAASLETLQRSALQAYKDVLKPGTSSSANFRPLSSSSAYSSLDPLVSTPVYMPSAKSYEHVDAAAMASLSSALNTTITSKHVLPSGLSLFPSNDIPLSSPSSSPSSPPSITSGFKVSRIHPSTNNVYSSSPGDTTDVVVICGTFFIMADALKSIGIHVETDVVSLQETRPKPKEPRQEQYTTADNLLDAGLGMLDVATAITRGVKSIID